MEAPRSWRRKSLSRRSTSGRRRSEYGPRNTPFSKKSELVLFCAGPVLSAFVSRRLAFGRVPRLFASLSLLRLAAAKVRPQCLGEAKTLGGFARTGCAGQNRNSALRRRPVIGAGQAHDFSLSKSFAKQPVPPAETWCPKQRDGA